MQDFLLSFFITAVFNIFRFIQQNKVLMIGILLPIVMVIIFCLVQFLPKFWVEPPKYNFIFASPFYENPSSFKFTVKNKRLFLEYHCVNNINFRSNWTVKVNLYIYDVKTKSANKVVINTPNVSVASAQCSPGVALIPVKQLAQYQIDSSEISPDGYKIQQQNLNYFFFDLFNISSQRNALSISKNNYTIGANYSNSKFIGWII